MTQARENGGSRSPTAQRLRRLRAVEGYETATAFANKLDISVPRYLNMEGGTALSIDVAQRIVKAVPGCSLDWLYNGVENGLTVDLRQRLAAFADGKARIRGSSRASA